MESVVKDNHVIKVGESSKLQISLKVKDKGDQFNGDIKDFMEPIEVIMV